MTGVKPEGKSMTVGNKELVIVPGAIHCDLYDGGYTEPAGKGEPKNMIPWDKLAEFFNKNLK